jgi:hypothetical protein
MLHITQLLLYSLSAYALTFVAASSSLFEPLREWVKARTPKLKIGNHRHFCECRMCLGLWTSVLVCNTDWRMILPVYGLSYWLATQERK